MISTVDIWVNPWSKTLNLASLNQRRTDMPNITLINGNANPVTHPTSSRTVGDLRSEMSFGSDIIISVDGTRAADSRALVDKALVSAVGADKTGGVSWTRQVILTK